MIILKIVLLIILGLILLILFAPFKYSALVLIREKINTSLFLDWVILKIEFLIEEKKLYIKIYVFGKLIKSISPKPKQKNKSEKKKVEKKRTAMLSKEFLSEIISLSKEVITLIKPKEFIVTGTYGFEDPSITGILNLVLIFIVEVMPLAQIDLNPVYEEEVMQIKISTYGSVSLIILISLLLKYVFKKEVRKVLFHKSNKN